MIKKTKKKHYFICPACHFAYKEKAWADKCEQWCNTYKSCNMEITKHAIQ